MPPKKIVKDTKVIEPEVEPTEVLEVTEESIIAILVPPFRVRRADANNIIIERQKQRKTSEELYWDVEGYYNSVVAAVTRLFYKDINARDVGSIRELNESVKTSEARILHALSELAKSVKL
jgi:hypothetical protein